MKGVAVMDRDGEHQVCAYCKGPLPDDEISIELRICYRCEEKQVESYRARQDWDHWHSKES